MGIHTGIKVFSFIEPVKGPYTNERYLIAVDTDDAKAYMERNSLERLTQLSNEVYMLEETFNVLQGVIPKEEGIIAGVGLYMIKALNMNRYYANGINPGKALEACVMPKRSWEWQPSYNVSMLTPGTAYTSDALKRFASSRTS